MTTPYLTPFVIGYRYDSLEPLSKLGCTGYLTVTRVTLPNLVSSCVPAGFLNIFVFMFDILECQMMRLNPACPQSFVRAEDLIT